MSESDLIAQRVVRILKRIRTTGCANLDWRDLTFTAILTGRDHCFLSCGNVTTGLVWRIDKPFGVYRY